MLLLLKRLAMLVTVGFWLGGLTFYEAIVIPDAHKILGSHLRVGFITQRVTGSINVAGVITLATLLWHTLSVGRRAGRLRKWLLLTWGMMAAAQAALLILHPALDGLLNSSVFEIVDDDKFYRFHRLYLILTMIQQLTGLFHLFCVLALWQNRDRQI